MNKHNRLLVFRIDELFDYRLGRKNGTLKRIEHEVLIVKNGGKYYLTNYVSITGRETLFFKNFDNEFESEFFV